MRRTSLLATAALLTLPLVAGAALAQSTPQGNDPTLGEMRRERMTPGLPAVPQQNRSASQADVAAPIDRAPAQWVRQAQREMRANRYGVANELLERAETRLLSRSTLASEAGTPIQDPAIAHLSAARSAMIEKDKVAAQQATSAALATLDGGSAMRGGMADDMSQGSSSVNMAPRRGRQGSTYQREIPDLSLGEAPPIILAQSGSGDSGGLGGSSPGSPGTGSIGSTPQVLPPTVTQPGQGAASGMAPSSSVGAPLPGTTPGARVNQRDNTAVMPGSQPGTSGQPARR